jgi:2-succinyl-5-enolpyruvyl-6-hydroxy-3-cyclohexene-1-carboxylate synthase
MTCLVTDSTVFSEKDTLYLWSTFFIEELVRNGVDLLCISPGSRSTPLVLAAASNKRLKKKVFYDERSAAFYALGYAKAMGKRVALLCTSGSALTHYAPAIVEAYQDGVPLVVVSADRPAELQGVGANQVIHQEGVFGNHLAESISLPMLDFKPSYHYLLSSLDYVLHKGRIESKPVHINVPLKKPLQWEDEDVDIPNSLKVWWKKRTPYTEYHGQEIEVAEEDETFLRTLYQEKRPGVLLVGKLSALERSKDLKDLIMHSPWPVWADLRSGYRHCCDSLATFLKEIKGSRIENIIHIGGSFVSSHILKLIKSSNCLEYVHVSVDSFRRDPHCMQTRRYLVSPKKIAGILVGASSKNKTKYLKEEYRTLTELSASTILFEEAPEGWGLYVSNSLPVRHLDTFISNKANSPVVEVNRGTSGIDGTIASAIGFAQGLGKPTFLLIGDIAFLHDVGSLQLLENITTPLMIVLLNNQGGGIFSFLPVSKKGDVFDTYFTTPHTHSFSSLASGFALSYQKMTTVDSFRKAISDYINDPKTGMVEVHSERLDTVSEYKNEVSLFS